MIGEANGSVIEARGRNPEVTLNEIIESKLKIMRYKYESRSLEAILEMSMLTNAKKVGAIISSI
jgi:hypothetical protein